MTDRPKAACPACGSHALETTADRGVYGLIGHWAVCCGCTRQMRIWWRRGRYVFEMED